MGKIESLRKNWIWILAGVLFVSFLFNRSFRSTILRRLEIRKTEKDFDAVNRDVDAARQRISELETKSSSYENLTRKELGYLRPGEKEVRFLNSDKK